MRIKDAPSKSEERSWQKPKELIYATFSTINIRDEISVVHVVLIIIQALLPAAEPGLEPA